MVNNRMTGVILLVDNNPTNLEVLLDALINASFEVALSLYS